MPRKVIIDGKQALVPDDATDEEINALFPHPGPPATVDRTTGQPVTIGAAPSNDSNSLVNFFRDAQTDLTQGGTRTGLGRALGYLQGRNNGYSGLPASGSQMLSTPFTGGLKALEGLSDVIPTNPQEPVHPLSGALKVLGGLATAATIPSMVMGGPVGASKAIEAVPSSSHAAGQLSDIAAAVGNTPVPLRSGSLDALQRLAEISQRGGSGTVPSGVNQLLERSQAIAPMTYPEARDFASAMSALSGQQKLEATPRVLAQMGELKSGLHGDIADAIGPYGPNYIDAIKEYAKAKAIQKTVKQAAKVGATGAAAYLVGKGAVNAYDKVTK